MEFLIKGNIIIRNEDIKLQNPRKFLTNLEIMGKHLPQFPNLPHIRPNFLNLRINKSATNNPCYHIRPRRCPPMSLNS